MSEPLAPELTLEKSAPEPPRTAKQKRIAFALSAMACFMLYVALSGPMSALHKKMKFKPMEAAIEVAYAPIVWLAKNRIEPFSSWLRAYIELFR